MPATETQIREALSAISVPGLNKDIVSFGLIEQLDIEGDVVRIRLSVPFGDSATVEELAQRVHTAASEVAGVDEVYLDVSAPRAAAAKRAPQQAPPAAPPQGAPVGDGGRPGPEVRRDPIPGVKYVLAVASGKGGVGKSTVASNVAVALSRKGMKVGLMDADIYGPSVPTMLGTHADPEITDVDGQRMIIPIERHGLKLMSLGFLQAEDDPVIWRGPLVMRAVKQFLRDVNWRDCDVLVIDLPPGTGDAQLTLTQQAPLDGAVIVTTPQNVSLIDARKGLHMFREVDVPVLGIVENMSVYNCPECGHAEHIFRSGGGRRTAEELGVPLLGDVPIDRRIAECGDSGTPAVLQYPDSDIAKAFGDIADKVVKALEANAAAEVVAQ